jgi:hypothetical protein
MLDSKCTGFPASDTHYPETRNFVWHFGSNPTMRHTTISISFCPPLDFARIQIAVFALPPRLAPQARCPLALSAEEVSVCGSGENLPAGRRIELLPR